MPAVHEEEIEARDRKKLIQVGFDVEEKERVATFTLVNDREGRGTGRPRGVELLSLAEATKKYPEAVGKHLWKLVSKDKDGFTRAAAEARPSGYFIRVREGHQAVLPLQACFFIKKERFKQRVHNLILMEKNASLNIINGCATADYVTEGQHVGVTEIYLDREATLSYTMIHDWSDEVEVRPRTGILVESGATFISNYISIKRSKITQTFPTCRLRGRNATGLFNSLIYAPEKSVYDVGARVLLEGMGSRAEVISRTISGGGKIVARGELIGMRKDIHAHLECSGMLLNDRGSIQAIPVLEAHHPDVNMSHEASVGKIAEEEIQYLMSRGIPQDRAVSLIVRGFLDTKILGLPPLLEEQVEKTIAMLEDAF